MKQRYAYALSTLLLLIGFGAFAQTPNKDSIFLKEYHPIIPDYRGVAGDSTVIPKAGQKQQKNYLQGKYSYPPKPRNKWEAGINAGGYFISGDTRTRGGYGFGLEVRKSLGYAFTLQGFFMHGTTYGLNWLSNTGLRNNPMLTAAHPQTDYLDSVHKFFYNYKNVGNELTLNILLNLNNIGYHKRSVDRKVNMLVGLGAGAYTYRTWYNALDKNGRMYKFQSVADPGVYTKRKTALKALKSELDGTYETLAEGQVEKPDFLSRTIDPVVVGTLGISYHLSKSLDLTLSERFTVTHDDLLDGNRWQEHPYADPVLTSDYDTYHYLSLSLGYFFGKKNSVEPLYWQNPMDYTYDALQNVLKKNVEDLLDTDDDGVIDKLDREPNTEKGMRVDTHGVTLDSDNDGIPDSKDKEPFSLPGYKVDANGVMINPPWGNMDSIIAKVTAAGGNMCNVTNMPSVHFELDKYFIQPEFYAHLHDIAVLMIMCPTHKMVATGYTDVRANDEYNDLLSWERATTCVDYLVKTYGIDRSRFIVNYKGERDPKFKGLPAKGVNPKYESRQYVNRRVEFRWANTGETGDSNPARPKKPKRAGKEY